MTKDSIRAKVLECLKRVAPEANTAAFDERLTIREQIEIDSIDYLSYVLGVEKALGVKVPDADYPKLASVEGAVAYLEGLLSQARSAKA
jgi:acyl carrier protein